MQQNNSYFLCHVGLNGIQSRDERVKAYHSAVIVFDRRFKLFAAGLALARSSVHRTVVTVEAAGAGAAAEIVGMGNDHHSLGDLVCRINIGNKFLRIGNGQGVTVIIITALYKGRSLGQIVRKRLALRHL